MTEAQSKPGTDLAAFDALKTSQEDGIAVTIVHPASGEDLGIVVTIAGPDSERQRKAMQKQVDERIRRRSAKPLSAAEMSESGVRMLAASVIGWNSVVVDGNDIPFSVEAAVSLFQRFPFIFEQVNAVAGDRAAFLKI